MERAPITQSKSTANADDLGHIRHISVDITKPLALKFEGDVNQIMIMIGPNGTGKSLMLKLTWCMNMCAKLYLAQGDRNADGIEYIFNKTFEENDLTGSIKYNWENGDIYFLFEDGNLIARDFNISDEVKSSATPIYMGKDMRTFDQIKLYLKMRSALKVPPVLDITATDSFGNLADTYKLYDIFYVEMLIAKLRHEIDAPENYKKALKGFEIDLEVDKIGFDRAGGMIYTKDKLGVRTNLHTLGAGHQSVMNMFLAQVIF